MPLQSTLLRLPPNRLEVHKYKLKASRELLLCDMTRGFVQEQMGSQVITIAPVMLFGDQIDRQRLTYPFLTGVAVQGEGDDLVERRLDAARFFRYELMSDTTFNLCRRTLCRFAAARKATVPALQPGRTYTQWLDYYTRLHGLFWGVLGGVLEASGYDHLVFGTLHEPTADTYDEALATVYDLVASFYAGSTY